MTAVGAAVFVLGVLWLSVTVVDRIPQAAAGVLLVVAVLPVGLLARAARRRSLDEGSS